MDYACKRAEPHVEHELGEPEVTAFLDHLAAERKVAPATQNQPLSALLFLYKEVLGRELAWLDGLQPASRPPRLPAVLTRAKVERVLAELQGTKWLIASLLYGSGLRLLECLRLRIKDVDLAYRQRSGDTLSACGFCTRAICARATARCTCPKYPRADASGAGSTCLRRQRARATRMTARCAATMSTNRCRSAR